MIHAPYNFVPLSEYVFFPEWRNKISLDVPFIDGISGMITLKIVAKSPVFVRNGHKNMKKGEGCLNDPEYRSFSKTPDNRYFIPSTSIKGAIRNVLEIMSFGKMSRVTDKRYGMRDLNLKKYMSAFQHDRVHCGWMSWADGKIKIEDCGIPRRISHEEIDMHFGTSFCEDYSSRNFGPASNRSALSKYVKLSGRSLNGTFIEKKLNPDNPVDKRIEVNFLQEGEHSAEQIKKGVIVFTGQASGRNSNTKKGKFYEFVFLDKVANAREYIFGTEDEIFMDFSFIYEDSEEWKYWKQAMRKGEKVPVFFLVDSNGNLLNLGLSYLYKLPYPQRINSYLYEKHKCKEKDFCECLFGKIGSGKGDDLSLKGRIQFSHAFCETGECYDEVLTPYMSSPKPTYYPIYIRQNGIKGEMKNEREESILYKTLFDKDARLKGWKRYPIRKEWKKNFEIPENQGNNITPFIPIKEGASFNCKIRFFNLKPEELGGLLYALDLPEKYYHSVGLAKPFGYGQIKVKCEDLKAMSVCGTKKWEKNEIDNLKKRFKDLMSNNISNYEESSQMKELWAMMKENELCTCLDYMELREFVECKKVRSDHYGEYLQDYTTYVKRVSQPVNKEKLYAEAEIICVKPVLKAKLSGGKQTFIMDSNNAKEKWKVGAKILVEKKMRGSNVERLKFIKKLQ